MQLPSAGSLGRQHSHLAASVSGRAASLTPSPANRLPVCQALLGKHDLEPSKLRFAFLSPSHANGPGLPAPRRYTLTHSDITGHLRLSIGSEYNRSQLSGWYLSVIRDEVLAEWRLGEDERPELHLFCHVSGSMRMPLPAKLRSSIFTRELPLVLRAILHADEVFLKQEQLLTAFVVVHLSSHVEAYNRVVRWGMLGEERTWPEPAAAWFELLWRSFARSRRKPPAQPLTPAALPRRVEDPESEDRDREARRLLYTFGLPSPGVAAERHSLETVLASRVGDRKIQAGAAAAAARQAEPDPQHRLTESARHT